MVAYHDSSFQWPNGCCAANTEDASKVRSLRARACRYEVLTAARYWSFYWVFRETSSSEKQPCPRPRSVQMFSVSTSISRRWPSRTRDNLLALDKAESTQYIFYVSVTDLKLDAFIGPVRSHGRTGMRTPQGQGRMSLGNLMT